MISKTQYSHFRSHSNHIVENYYSGEKQNEKIYDVEVKSLFALYKVEVISLLALYKVQTMILMPLCTHTKCKQWYYWHFVPIQSANNDITTIL